MEKNDKKVEATKKEAMNFAKSLFSFDKLFFIDFLFFIHILFQVLIFVLYLIWAFSTGNPLQILWIMVLYPAVFFVIRLLFEFLSVQFSINQNLLEIKKNLKK